MKRREFIALLGGTAVAWPTASRAQQPAMPVIGYVNSGTVAANPNNVAAFRLSLKEAGFTEGQNVAIEFRWAENQFDRLPALVGDLIQRPVTVIVGNTLAAAQAKVATATVPIVFTTGSDPVRDGLVASLNRPGGNVTGVVFLQGDLGAKRLELLRELMPKATTIAMLMNPNTPETEAERRDLQLAAQAIGLQLIIFGLNSTRDIETAFTTLTARGVDAVFAGTGTFVFNNREQIVALAARHSVPTIYAQREAVIAGGLMSYGANIQDAFRQAGTYVGRILKGEKPADLPVIRSTKIALVINLKTARTLGLEVPARLLALADEAIE